MKSIILTLFFTFFIAFNFVQAQNGWSICNTPTFDNRVDDVFMVNAKVGYAASGDGQIVKTINGGLKWENLLTDASVYCRSVEFVNEKKGFVGGFPSSFATSNMLRKTIDGGKTWTDLTQLLNPKAARGICGLAAPDSNTIYGCGNWYDEEAYIVKSNDGGDSWSFIDMAQYASALIDMHFVSKDTGFATGRGPLPLRTSVVLYTTDGGLTWTYTFKNNVESQYCWKIQSLTNKIYFASIEDFKDSPPKMIKSTDGGFTWNIYNVSSVNYNVEGIGFIDTNLGWLGGGPGFSFVTKNGGETWAPLNNVCPYMNRIFRVMILFFLLRAQVFGNTPPIY